MNKGIDLIHGKEKLVDDQVGLDLWRSRRASVVERARAIPSETTVLLERVERVSSRDADGGDHCTMEHRLGTRISTSLPVRIVRARAPLAFGSMLNASSSGAFIETSAMLPLLARIDVVCGPTCPDRAHCPGMSAYVTRVGRNGVGIEWFEFAPAMIRQLVLGESEGFQKRKKAGAGVKSPRSPVAGADSSIARAMAANL